MPQNASPVWAAQRLTMVRGFARYLQAVDPATQVPPAGMLRPDPPGHAQHLLRRRSRRTDDRGPDAAQPAEGSDLRDPDRTARGDRACGVARRWRWTAAIWTTAGLLIVRATKFRKSRQLPLQVTTLRALASYQAVRDRLCPAPPTASLLVSATGARLCQATVHPAFRRLLRQAGIGQGPPRPRATIHGLRHSFAVKTLIGWYRDGQDVQARMRPCRPGSVTSPRPPRTGT